MSEQQISTAANAVAGLAEVSGMQVDDILELLAGNIFTEEDCGNIRRHIEES